MLFAKRSLRDIASAWMAWVGPVVSSLTTSPLAAQQVIDAFREAGAITVQTAQPFHARSALEQTGLHPPPEYRGRSRAKAGSLLSGRSRPRDAPEAILTSAVVKLLPNKRLKLTSGDRSKGSGVLCPWRGTDFVPHPCAGERVARSLSAIR